MAKAKITLELDQTIIDEIRALIARPEFSAAQLDPDTKQVVPKPVYDGPEAFLARAVIRQGLMQHSHCLPSVIAMQQSIDDQRRAMEDFLTPTVALSEN